MTDGVHVNLALRQDLVGDVLRQKQTLERVSEVLCDGLGDDPTQYWRSAARIIDAGEKPHGLADRLRAIADLIEAESL